jgi:hypothetical protein
MTFEPHNRATGELVGMYPEPDEGERNIRPSDALEKGGDVIRFCGLILTRALLSAALILGFALFLTVAILRVVHSAFEK